MSVVSCVCCQVEMSTTSWSLVRRSPTDWCVVVCDLETWCMRRLWPTGGYCTKNKQKQCEVPVFFLIVLILKCQNLSTHMLLFIKIIFNLITIRATSGLLCRYHILSEYKHFCGIQCEQCH